MGRVQVPSIRSDRLELVSMSPAFLELLLEGLHEDAAGSLGADIPKGWPGRHDAGFLRLRLDQMRRDPESEEWLVRALVLPDEGRTMIGHAGFHGKPGVNGPQQADAVELGYTVFPVYRGRGYATEAAVALMRWAQRERGITHFVASVAPDNNPSLAIVRKLGFVQTGEQWDEEDGLELVFELERGA
jgi:RimJ/RimL family protein N-acetyltransferase